MKKVTELVAGLAQPVAERLGCEVWDVEFVREGGQWYLRVYIDRPEGVDISLCEDFSREMDKILDEADPVEQSYIFEVSSPGIDRVLKRPSDFMRFIGYKVDVKLYRAQDGKKVHTGTLKSYSEAAVTIEAAGKDLSFGRDEIALVRLAVEF
ncbi:MAG: ribosome maturation factor RimP [Oscillospiraceae bacterium]|jgi:ribosome maturation factor RimP